MYKCQALSRCLLLVGCIITIFFMTCIFGCKSDNKEKKAEEISNQAIGIDEKSYKELEFLKLNFKYGLENNFAILRNAKVYYGNDTTKIFKILPLIKKNTLVFRFSGKICDRCIDMVIKEMQHVFPNYAKTNQIVLLGSELNPQVKDTFFGKKVLSYFKNETIGLAIEKDFVPFMFLTDNNGKVNQLFIVDAEHFDLTKQYLQSIKSTIQ